MIFPYARRMYLLSKSVGAHVVQLGQIFLQIGKNAHLRGNCEVTLKSSSQPAAASNYRSQYSKFAMPKIRVWVQSSIPVHSGASLSCAAALSAPAKSLTLRQQSFKALKFFAFW